MLNNRFVNTILVTCFLLIFSNIGQAQRRVEKLKSDESVMKFVKSFFSSMEKPDPAWNNFQLVDGMEWKGLYNLNSRVEDSLSQVKVKKWETADFNFDKKLDLVVCGKIPRNGTNQYVLLAIITNENGDYDVKSLVPEEYQTYPYYFSLTILPKVGVPAVRLVKWFPDINNESPNGYPFTVDTLGFAQEYLVNYNSKPDSAVFKKVQFDYLQSDGKRAIVNIDKLNTGTTSPFKVVIYNKYRDSTVIDGKITLDIYAELLSLINYAGFKELPDYYQTNTSNNGTYVLDILYGDGTKKKLTDYAGGGTYSLAAIYTWLAWLIDYSSQSSFLRRVEQKGYR